MTSPKARFAFAANPRALEDLRQAPAHIQDLVLLHLQDLVHGEQRGPLLHHWFGQDLSDCRKLYVDPQAAWRIVYQERRAPTNSAHRREIFLIAVGPRLHNEVYNTAVHRLGRERTAQAPLAQAALARSPRFLARTSQSASAAAARPAAPLPLDSFSRKAPR
ncbi:hypothetical protein ACFS5L_02310 [Streptomyces phyllanthi]|uniref:Uncharacterized protein n=1 Tax=Streptomyces phyllanthi TaxID=1803180 RepID=A0A5N8VUY0_9ACTN|nr:hypothetical protein [Streptomyces phyllanthi]MPY38486.1 hypothetical protein [Streptomyces phyllanthi]